MPRTKKSSLLLKLGVVFGLVIGVGLICVEALIITSSEVTPEESVFVEPQPQEEVIAEAPAPVIELPFGGTNVLPEYQFVALYGSPLHEGLGALGEQSLGKAVTRAKEVAAQYDSLTDKTVIPTFEIITTVAAAELTDDDDYSRETSIEKIQPWVDRAADENIYVLLDIQPGRDTFLEQAKQYESLLLEPHVGLALDPEWRLQTERDRHLVRVGSVSATEVNETAEWLAQLVAENELPQKMFLVHQFKASMITDRDTLKADYPELGYVIHMDGHGALGSKELTYQKIIVDDPLPSGAYPGWKNFYDEDRPTPTPAETMKQQPMPLFISYQ